MQECSMCVCVCMCVCVSQVENCIVGWDSRIGSWSRLENTCVLGEDVQVKVRAYDMGHICVCVCVCVHVQTHSLN